MNRRLKPGRRVRLATAGAVLWMASAAAIAADVDISLPAQPLDQAIRSLAQAQGLQVFYSPDLVRGLQAPAVSGRMSARQALEALLAGQPLRLRQDGDAYILEPAPAASELAPIEVSASRTSGLFATQQTIVLEREALQELRTGSDSLATLLSKQVPGMADSSRTITDYGQTLRGRGMLVLVDGIPLNTNRDSSRNLANVDPASIERIEVMRGSSSIYGAGATGGIVSITTRPAGGEPVAETTVTAISPLSRLRADGLGGQLQQYFAGSQGMLDYALDLGARHNGASYDARGRRIASEPSQGDLFDSNIYSLGGKLGLRIDDKQRVQLSASYYNADQDSDYGSDPTVARLPAGSTRALPLGGLELVDQNQIRNTMLNLEYEHLNVWGSKLSAQVYYRDFYTRFTPFDARAVVTRGNHVDQVMQSSKVWGSRLTLDTPLAEHTRLLWGADFNQERSDMPIDIFDAAAFDASGGRVFRKTGRLTYMPELTTRSTGIFAQLEHRFTEQWSAHGGLRYEYAQASFDDFMPLSQLRVANPTRVSGGSVNYDAILSNIGLTFAPVPDHEFYTTFSQGFQLPDIGVQMRNARPGFDISSSDLEPVKINNYELGWRGSFGRTSTSLALFYTTSKLGDVQSFNNGLILTRTKERIYGVEATLDTTTDDERWGAGGTLTWMQGREQPDNGDWRDMTGYRIPPLKLSAYLQYRPNERWTARLQGNFQAAHDYRLDGVASFGRRDVSSYFTVDLMARYQFSAKDTLTLGVENLFNRDYYPLYSQLLRSNTNTSRLPASGAVLKLIYQHRW